MVENSDEGPKSHHAKVAGAHELFHTICLPLTVGTVAACGLDRGPMINFLAAILPKRLGLVSPLILCGCAHLLELRFAPVVWHILCGLAVALDLHYESVPSRAGHANALLRPLGRHIHAVSHFRGVLAVSAEYVDYPVDSVEALAAFDGVLPFGGFCRCCEGDEGEEREDG
jgi:hypothetical protein